jgi:hypothetical protein
MTRGQYADSTYRLAYRLASDEAFRQRERDSREGEIFDGVLRLGDEREMVHTLSPRGTARDYAGLLERIVAGTLISEEVSRRIRDRLELAADTARAGGASGFFLRGQLPGVLAIVGYRRDEESGEARVLAMLVEDLPVLVWLQLQVSGAAEGLAREMLAGGDLLETARKRLTL